MRLSEKLYKPVTFSELLGRFWLRLEDGPIQQYESDTTQAPRERLLDAGNQKLGCSIQFEVYNSLDAREANATYVDFS